MVSHLRQPSAKGPARGATLNPTSRFEPYQQVGFDDGWEIPGLSAEPPPPVPTRVTPELTRRIISTNQSPDVPFRQSINPYKGCEHGCIYCFARPTHAYLGLSPGLDFETRIVSKPQAAQRLREAFSRPGYRPSVIALGANTDPYQPVERRLGITRQVLEVFREFQHPVGIVTKSVGVLRDLDILTDLAAANLAMVMISITTLDPAVARRLEPRAAAPNARLKALQRLHQARVPVGVLVSPVIPAITDGELEAILEAAAQGGAQQAGTVLIRLPLEVAPLFEAWLEKHYPDRKDKVLSLIRQSRGGELYRATFGERMRGTGAYANLLQKRFSVAVRRLGLNERRYNLDTTRFRVPPRKGDQLTLW